MKQKTTLLYIALRAEASAFIGNLKLTKIDGNMWENDTTLLIVGGIGSQKAQKHLRVIFKTYTFEKAINVGIAGCVDKSIAIGSLFCTNQVLQDIAYATLSSFDNAVTWKQEVSTTLVDMEAKTFEEIALEYLHVKNIFVFKIVSDYLESTIPTKKFVSEIMQKNIKKIKQYV